MSALLSRVADSIFWMSRYIERAENVARFIDVNTHLLLDAPPGTQEQWMPLVATSGDAAVFEERYRVATMENVVQFLTFDAANPNSILSCLRFARENARTVRETISSEMWEQCNMMHLMLTERIPQGPLRGPVISSLFYDIRMACHLFQGIAASTMSHGEAWHFIRLGRMLERADKTSRILDVKYFLLLPRIEHIGTPIDDIQWAAVLKSVSGFEMYRKRFGRIQPHRVVEFLLQDENFPRAIRHCLITGADSLHEITGTPKGSARTILERRIGQLKAELDYANIEEIITDGLHEFRDELQVKLNLIDDSIYHSFFALRPLAGTPAAS
jgi:uncharacterized alpha-E superfamily protein